MRVNIPYDLIDNIENVEFISFILEGEDQPLYRLDLERSKYKKIFSKSQKYILAPKNFYKKCDTIIFYPYYKNTGWGRKLFKRKGLKTFVPFGGSLNLVKNSQIQGDIEAVKKWIYDGANIKVDNKVVGSKNLIYFTLFGDVLYVKLLDLLISTLKNQKYKNFDILFITDKKTSSVIKKIKHLKEFNVDYLILKKIDDPVIASMQKLKIYDYQKIDNYANILFLDVDIVVVGNVGDVFEKKSHPNIFYSAVHRFTHEHHKTKFHSLIEYSNKKMERFQKRNIFPFNAGQFFFKNTKTMRNHFRNINDFISNWTGEYFFEQSFLNCYFNVLEISNVFKFKEQFSFVSINENETKNSFDQDCVFIHFMGSTSNPEDKLFFIKNYYPDTINIKTHP